MQLSAPKDFLEFRWIAQNNSNLVSVTGSKGTFRFYHRTYTLHHHWLTLCIYINVYESNPARQENVLCRDRHMNNSSNVTYFPLPLTAYLRLVEIVG